MSAFLIRFLDVFLGRDLAGLGVVDPPRVLVAQDPVGVGDAVEDLVDLGLELGGHLAVEPVGVEAAGHLEIGLLDVLFRGRLGDVQDLVEGHRREGFAEGQDLGDRLRDVGPRRRGTEAGLHVRRRALGFALEIDDAEAVEEIQALPELVARDGQPAQDDLGRFLAVDLLQDLLLFGGQEVGVGLPAQDGGAAGQEGLQERVRLHAPDAVLDEEGDADPGFGGPGGDLRERLKIDLGVEDAEDVEDALPDLVAQGLRQVVLRDHALGLEGLADALAGLDELVDLGVGLLRDALELEEDLAQALVRHVRLDLDDRALVEEEVLEDLLPPVDQAAGLLVEEDVPQVGRDVVHGASNPRAALTIVKSPGFFNLARQLEEMGTLLFFVAKNRSVPISGSLKGRRDCANYGP